MPSKNARQTVSVASSGTEGTCVIPAGHKLIGLEVPAVDNTTITPSVSSDGGVTYRNCYDSAGNQITIGGAANTGNRFVEASDALGNLTLGASHLKLTVASQTGGARSIGALFAEGGF